MQLNQYIKEFQYNLTLAYPVILGMLGHTLIGIVDNYMVGNLGSTELAAVSLGNSFIFIGLSLGIGFSTAITPLIAEAAAEAAETKIKDTFQQGLMLCTIIGIVVFLCILVSKPIMQLMNQPAAVVDMAGPYMVWVGFSLIPVIMFQAYKQFADGLAQTKYSMYAIYLANVVHVVFNYILIYGFWFFPKLGVIGAALGTVISRIMMLVFMHYLMKNKTVFKPYFKDFSIIKIQKTIWKKIISLGFPSAMQMLFEVSLFTAAIWLSGCLGKNDQAANQIALTLASSTYMVAMGLSVTAMIRLSHLKGANDYKSIIPIAKSIFVLTVLIELFFAFILILFHGMLPALFLNFHDTAQFLDNEKIIMLTSKLLLIAAFFQISDGIQVVVLGALRGLQDVKIPMYICFFAYWIVGFPCSYYLGFHTIYGTTGIWIGLWLGLSAAAILLYIRFRIISKKIIQKH